jgi:selenide,water dikinase
VKTDLLKFTDQGGCSSKIPPAQLEEILRHLPVTVDPDILVNIDTHDDAGVYRINDDLALVLTTDFFPPVVSDPYEFGQIAAANSISDVYAMGGKPMLGLNIMMFPAGKLPIETFGDILRGGFNKAAEAGVKIIGGHTIDDPIPKYGLAVTGFVNPKELVTNAGSRPGDKLILTKPVGTGIILAGHRLGIASGKDMEETKRLMKQLNEAGAEVMRKYGIKGGTDITGFGLAGHALKMAKASLVTVKLNMPVVPLIGDTLALVEEGCIPGACFTNLEYAEKDLSVSSGLSYNHKMIAFDAQTSGGLLISAPASLAEAISDELRNKGFPFSIVIGEVTEQSEKLLYLCD